MKRIMVFIMLFCSGLTAQTTIVCKKGELVDKASVCKNCNGQDELFTGLLIRRNDLTRKIYSPYSIKQSQKYIQISDAFGNTNSILLGEGGFNSIDSLRSFLGGCTTNTSTGEGATSDWSEITNKPTTFNPASHTHAQSEITGLTANLGQIEFNLQQSINEKQDQLYSGTNIKTVNGSSLLGSGDLAISGGDVSGKLNTSDTSAMLQPYAKTDDLGGLYRGTLSEIIKSVGSIDLVPSQSGAIDFIGFESLTVPSDGIYNFDLTAKADFEGSNMLGNITWRIKDANTGAILSSYSSNLLIPMMASATNDYIHGVLRGVNLNGVNSITVQYEYEDGETLTLANAYLYGYKIN